MGETPRAPEWLEAANFHAIVAQLLATVTHQVNNALQTIGGHAELLRTDPGASATTMRRGEAIAGVTARVADLLAEVQALARPPSTAAPLDLHALAETAVALRQYSLQRAKIQARIEGDHRPRVGTDTHALLQVVLNLIMNAEHALERVTHGVIELSVSRIGDRAVLCVDDNGPGLLTSPPVDPGSLSCGRLGLGLTVSRAIVLRLGGEVSFLPSPLGGTRVSVSLPAADAPYAAV